MMLVKPRVLLCVAMPRLRISRWRSTSLQIYYTNPRCHDFRVFSMLISSRESCTQKSTVRTSKLQRLMSEVSPNGSKQQRKQERENDERTAAMVLKDKLKKDLKRAKSLAMHQVINVPNVITAARIFSTPYLVYLIVQGDHVSAIALLAAAGASDWLDGFIARTFHQESILGSFLDPFADKLLIGALSFSMMWTGLLPLPLAALILGRDGMLIGGTFYYRLSTKEESSGFFDTADSGSFQVKPSALSKMNTALQLATFGFALTNAAWQMPSDFAMKMIFVVVGTTTLLSGSEYLYGYLTKTGAFRPLPRPVKRPLCKAVQRTEAVVKRTKEVMGSSSHKVAPHTKGRQKK